MTGKKYGMRTAGLWSKVNSERPQLLTKCVGSRFAVAYPSRVSPVGPDCADANSSGERGGPDVPDSG
jgi:hypothetical protein